MPLLLPAEADRDPHPHPHHPHTAPHVGTGFSRRGMRSRLLTQMYFEGERRNEDDMLLKRRGSESRATMMSKWVTTPAGTVEKDALAAEWTVVLNLG